MSEKPDGPAPEPGTGEESPAPGRWSRWLPPWARRRPAIAATSAGILAAAAVALVVFAVTRPSAPRLEYASLPGQPCALVSSAELARYMPGATGTPVNANTSFPTVKIGGCKWSSTSGGEDRTLGAAAFVFGAPGAISDAQQSYRHTLADLGCRCKGVTVSRRTVTGLGDEATELFIAAAPDANPASAPNATSPGNTLIVHSSNAMVIISLNTTGTASGAPLASPPSAVQLAG